MNRNILIVSAHPDDMEIGMGGTVAKLVAEEAEITSLIVTDGGRASNPFGAAGNSFGLSSARAGADRVRNRKALASSSRPTDRLIAVPSQNEERADQRS